MHRRYNFLNLSISKVAGTDQDYALVQDGVNKEPIPNQRNAYAVLILNFEFTAVLVPAGSKFSCAETPEGTFPKSSGSPVIFET